MSGKLPFPPKPYEAGDRVTCRESGRHGTVESWQFARNSRGAGVTKTRKYTVRMDGGRLEHFMYKGLRPEEVR